MIFNAISAASGGGGAKIATGSYVGTGTYGSSNPCSLTFDFAPKLVYITARVALNASTSYFGELIITGVGFMTKFSPVDSWIGTGYAYEETTAKIVNIKCTKFNTTTSWASLYNAYTQCNVNKVTYYYLAIG